MAITFYPLTLQQCSRQFRKPHSSIYIPVQGLLNIHFFGKHQKGIYITVTTIIKTKTLPNSAQLKPTQLNSTHLSSTKPSLSYFTIFYKPQAFLISSEIQRNGTKIAKFDKICTAPVEYSVKNYVILFGMCLKKFLIISITIAYYK